MFSFRNLAVCLLASSLLAGCGPKEPAVHQAADPVTNVQITTVVLDAPHAYETTGSIKAREGLRLASRIPAYIRSMPVAEGQLVKKGTILVELDPTDVNAGIAQAQAALAAASADLKDAQTDYTKFSALYKEESVSDNELRKTRLRLEAAQAKEKAARAQLMAANVQREYSTIRAPIDGWVSQKLKHTGDMAVPALPIVLFDSAADPQFETALPEDMASRVKPGDKVSVRIDGEKTPRAGLVDLVVPSADPLTRTHLTKISFPAGTDALVPGRFGRAYFDLGGSVNPAVDNRAIVRRGGLDGVFVVDKDRARFQWIRLGTKLSGSTEVLAGLTGNEKVVLTPPLSLVDNGRVEVVEAAQ